MQYSQASRDLGFLKYVIRAKKPVATTEAAVALGLTVPTAHRIAVRLESEGFLRRALGSKRLVMGPQLAQLGLEIAEAWLGQAPRHAILQGLTEEIGEQCELGVLQGKQIVYVDGGRTAVPASLQFEPGLHAPIHCTSIGKLFLASLSEGSRRSLIASLDLARYTPRTIVNLTALLREISEVRRNDYAMSNEEYVIGVVGCGVPVLGPRKKIVAGLAISVPAARVPFTDLPKYIPALRRAAGRLTSTLSE